MKRVSVIGWGMLAVLACTTGVAGCGSARAGGPYGPGGPKALIVALDRSKSMHITDPSGLGPLGLQAMIAMAPPGANFGVLSYGQRVQEIAPMRSLQSKSDREQVAQASRGLRLDGKTDFQIAFSMGEEILHSVSAPQGSSLVLLTDGQHNVGKEGTILDTVESFKKQQWEINALAFTPQREIPFLEDVARGANGEAHRINNPGKLLEVTLNVTARPEEMFAFSGGYSALTVLPGTKHLLLAALKSSVDAGFISMNPVQADLETQPFTRESPSVYAYPPKLGDNTPFEIMNILAPPSGIWEIVMQGLGNPSPVHVLCDLPVEMLFVEDSLSEVYGENEPLSVVVKISSDNAELRNWIRLDGSVKVVAEPRGLGETAKMNLEFSEELSAEDEQSLVYTGEARLYAGGSELVDFTLTAVLTIKCDSDGAWTGRTRTSIKMTPGGSSLEAEPTAIDFGHRWHDEQALSQEFEVFAVYPGRVAAKLPDDLPDYLSGEPTEFDVTDELKQKVKLTFDPSKVTEFGPFEYKLLLANTILVNNSKGMDLPVTITASTYKIEIETVTEDDEEVVVKFTTRPGEDSTQTILMTVTPPLKFTYGPLVLKSESGMVTAEASQDEEGNTLLALSIALDTEDGVYEGELEMTPEIEGLASRLLKISLSVVGTPQVFVEPAEINVEVNKNGWIEQEVTIWADHYEDIGFAVSLNDIASESPEMLISGQFDAEFVPLDDWDGKLLQPGKKYKGNLRYYISTDLRAGSYEGEAKIRVTYRGDKEAVVKLPVNIKLTR